MTTNNEKSVAPNADEFLGGNYLRKEDLKEAKVVNVIEVWSEAVLNANRKKLVMAFQELEKPLILNKINIKRMVRIFGTSDTSAWRGPLTIYVEQGVEYGGRVVGGIRVKPAERIQDGRDRKPAINGFAHSENYEPEAEFF